MVANRPLPAEMQSVHARALRALCDVRPANGLAQGLAGFESKAQRYARLSLRMESGSDFEWPLGGESCHTAYPR